MGLRLAGWRIQSLWCKQEQPTKIPLGLLGHPGGKHLRKIAREFGETYYQYEEWMNEYVVVTTEPAEPNTSDHETDHEYEPDSP